MINLNFNNETGDSKSDTDVQSSSPDIYWTQMIATWNRMVFTPFLFLFFALLGKFVFLWLYWN